MNLDSSTAGLGVVAFAGWSLAGYFFRLVYTGKLVPRSTYDDKCHEADEWRTEGRIKDQTIHEIAEQNNILSRDLVPAVTGFFEALSRPKRRDREVDK